MPQKPPLIIQHGNRKAIVEGRCVRLLKMKNKRKDEGVWPETEVADGVARMHAAFLWTMRGQIDFGDRV